MQPLHYLTPALQVGLIGTLLSGMALNWFSPILEKNSPLLYDFEGFMEEFAACFVKVCIQLQFMPLNLGNCLVTLIED
jgi:hypothetical protein